MKYTIITVMVLLAGCLGSNLEPLAPLEITPDFKPLPPEKLHDLLLREDLKNIAYKSPSPKDYIIKEYN